MGGLVAAVGGGGQLSLGGLQLLLLSGQLLDLRSQGRTRGMVRTAGRTLGKVIDVSHRVCAGVPHSELLLRGQLLDMRSQGGTTGRSGGRMAWSLAAAAECVQVCRTFSFFSVASSWTCAATACDALACLGDAQLG